MLKPHQKFSGRQHTRWIAFLLAAAAGPIGLVTTAPNSRAVITFILLVSAVCLRFAWVHWSRHSDLSVPSLDLR